MTVVSASWTLRGPPRLAGLVSFPPLPVAYQDHSLATLMVIPSIYTLHCVPSLPNVPYSLLLSVIAYLLLFICLFLFTIAPNLYPRRHPYGKAEDRAQYDVRGRTGIVRRWKEHDAHVLWQKMYVLSPTIPPPPSKFQFHSLHLDYILYPMSLSLCPFGNFLLLTSPRKPKFCRRTE